MANEIKEIGEFVRKCKILLLDIEGTTTSISFVKDKLFPYAEENVKKFLESQWENDDVKEAVNALRKLALEDTEKSVDGAVAIPGEDASKEDQIEGVVNNVKWQMSSDRKAGPLKELQGMIWKQGYDNGDIKGHVFDDVSLALEQWHSVDGQKVYIYSSGSVQAQKLLFGQSLAGDLLKYIDGHFDTAVGGKQESDSYKAIVEKIGCNPDEILFLTDILKEAEAARGAGLHVVLVSREGNAALPDEASAYPLIHSLGQLTSNKRKTDPQEADLPAKIPKTDTTEDSSAAAEPNNITETSNESEKMDVEDVVEKPREDGSEKESDDKVEIQESATVIEEVTDVKGVPVTACDIEPIITEVTEDENSKKHEIEKMDTDSEEKQETIENGKTECKDTKISELSENSISENAEQNKVSEKSESTAVNEKLIDSKSEEHTSISEETPPIIITEIEEIKDDKELLCDVADVIEDVVPIVEEPVMNEDIEELQNVGDVLEKECDEILSKVQDVTNLDSIPVKPLLNPIVEESMETENTDSNDIVDRILDRELELEMKQSAEVEQPVEVTEGKNDNNEISKSEVEVTEGKNDNNEISKSEDSNAISKDQHENKETITGATKEINSENGIDKEEPVNNVLSAPEVLKENSLNEKIDSQNNDSENKTPETKTETLTEEKVELVESEEGQINGKATNRETEAKQNGDTGEDEELKSRLSAENGKEIVNGSNGDSLDVENRLSDKKTDSEATEIKVKTIATEEPSTELIEQPTEA